MKVPTSISLAAASLGLAMLVLPACTTTYITPMATASPARVDKTRDQAVPADTKVFSLQRDWQYGPWIMKRGAQILFRSDGTGEFSGTVYAQTDTAPQELHFQSIQYGLDGNRLFSFPQRDVGFRMIMRRSNTDYVYNQSFGFDERHFDHIHSVKFFARLRLDDEHVGRYDAKGTTYTTY